MKIMNITLGKLQKEQEIWGNHNFGPQAGERMLLGVSEEVGELCHAHLKSLQGIRKSTEELVAKKKDAIGDIVIYLTAYCNSEGIDFQECVDTAWNEVSQRDWKKFPKNGLTE